MIKNLADAEKLGNKSASTYILVTQLIEIFNICIFQLPKILHNPKKYLKVELKTVVEEIVAKEKQQNSYRMFFWSHYVKIKMFWLFSTFWKSLNNNRYWFRFFNLVHAREGNLRPNKGDVTTKISLRLTIPYWVVIKHSKNA